MTTETKHTPWKPAIQERWRHGGWYVHNIRYPSGGCGCVHNNHINDNKWHIAGGEFECLPFSTRRDAATAEHIHVTHLHREAALSEQNSELLEALKEILTCETLIRMYRPAATYTLEKARTAIAKAEGREYDYRDND